MSYGYAMDRGALIKRLHRIEGQVRGIERMIGEERYCIDILTQISAAATALDAVAVRILGAHAVGCFADAVASGDHEPRSATSCSRPSSVSCAQGDRGIDAGRVRQPARVDTRAPLESIDLGTFPGLTQPS